MEVLLSLICTISFFACIWFLISAIIKRAKAGREGVSKEEASREPIKKALISIGVSILSFIAFMIFAPEPTPTFSCVLNANEQGEYGVQKTLNEGTDMAYTFYEFHIPSGVYTVTNNGESSVQVTVFDDGYTFNSDGVEEYNRAGDIAVIQQGEEATVQVNPGQYVKLSDGNDNILFEQKEQQN